MADVTIDDGREGSGRAPLDGLAALSRPEAVKAETRELVLRVAEELGYTMSPLAQALRSKTSIFIPLIVPDLINPFYAELATDNDPSSRRPRLSAGAVHHEQRQQTDRRHT